MFRRSETQRSACLPVMRHAERLLHKASALLLVAHALRHPRNTQPGALGMRRAGDSWLIIAQVHDPGFE